MIDVIIPCIPDDLKLLKLCITGVRKNIEDEICQIYVISKYDINIINFCFDNRLIYVNENTLMGFDPSNISSLIRPGWIYQQLLKLHANIGICDNYLCIDADHILLKPHKFINTDGSHNFYCRDEYYKLYFNTIYDMFGKRYNKAIKQSFISDKMIFNKSYIRYIKSEIEHINNDNWINVIFKHFDGVNYSFSEFETYGTWLMYNHSWMVKIVDANRYMSNDDISNMTYDELISKFGNYLSITQSKCI